MQDTVRRETQMSSKNGRQTETGSLTNKQTDTQTQRQTNRQTYRETY